MFSDASNQSPSFLDNDNDNGSREQMRFIGSKFGGNKIQT
jgi:hypothetical protein